MFSVTKVENTVTVGLARDLTEADVIGKSVLRTNVRATREHVGENIAAVVVQIGTTTPAPPAIVPKFSKSLYRGSLGTSLELDDVEHAVVDEATYDSDVAFSLRADSNSDNALFNIDNSSNTVHFSLSRSLTENDVFNRTYLVAVLSASRPEVEPTSTVLLVNIPVTTPPPEVVTPVFAEPVFRGSIDIHAALTMADVILRESTYTDEITFELEGDERSLVSLFTLKNVRNVVTIQLRQGVTAINQFEGRFFLNFEVVALHPEANRARTSVLISLPGMMLIIDCLNLILYYFRNHINFNRRHHTDI